MVSPFIGQAGCPGLEPDCLKPAGTWVGVSARMYNDSNSLGNSQGGSRKQRQAGGNKRLHTRGNSHADRAEDGRRSNCRHSANSLWERVHSCMTVGATIVVADAGGRGEGVSLITGVNGSTEVGK